MLRAAPYLRVSTARQADHDVSIPDQKRHGEARGLKCGRRLCIIVTISSVSGLVSNGGGTVYSTSKFAVKGWMEGFAQELAPLGVRSLLVEPGMLRTDFMDGKSASFGSIDIPDYADALAEYRSFVDAANGNQPGNPKLLAARIVELASQDEVPPRIMFGDDARQWASAKIDQYSLLS